MGNKIKKLIMFLIIVFGITLFANEEQKAPNEVIKDNPEREVTTVDSMKVRDHATLSLTVNKKNEQVIEGELVGDTLKVKLPVEGINEKNLDKTGKVNGEKKLVVESESKQKVRRARSLGSVTDEKPTQDEMNNLTSEEIRNIMDRNKEKTATNVTVTPKEYVAVPTEDGINLDILGVDRSEDTYVNVEDNGKRVGRYRILARTARAVVGSSIILDGERIGRVNAIDDDWQWLSNKENTKNITMDKETQLRLLEVTKGTYDYVNKLEFKDDFFYEKRVLELIPVSAGATFGFQYSGKDAFYVSPLPYIGTIGTNNESYLDMNKRAQNTNSYAYRLNRGQLFLANDATNISAIAASTFKRLELVEKAVSTDEIVHKYLQGKVTKVGMTLTPKVKTPKEERKYLGYYKTVSSQGYVAYFKDPNNQEILRATLKDLAVDIGDKQIQHNNPTDEKIYKKTFDRQVYSDTWYIINDPNIYDNNSISFMKKDGKDGLGLFLINKDGARVKIPRYIEEGNYCSATYNQGKIEQKFRIRVSQDDSKWAKVEIMPENIINPSDGSNPMVEFTIVQGREFIGGYAEYRRVKYVVTFPRTIEYIEKENINIEVDERILNLVGMEKRGEYTWLNLNRGLGKWGSSKTQAPEVVYIDGTYSDNDNTISEVRTVNRETIESSTGDGYDRFTMPNSNRYNIAFKRGVTFTELVKSDNFMISPAIPTTYEVMYKAINSSINEENNFKSIITLKHMGEEVYNSESYDKVNGFKGKGTAELSGKMVDVEYTIVQLKSGGLGENELILSNPKGELPNFKGFVTGQTDKIIASKYKVNGSDFIEMGKEYEVDNEVKIKLAIPSNVTDRKNLKITKLKDIDFNKTFKIEYYHSTGMKLGEYVLTVNNSKRVEVIGAMATQIDPRLKQKSNEWITLTGSGNINIGNLSPSRYVEFINDTNDNISATDKRKKIVNINEIKKDDIKYTFITNTQANVKEYVRYGRNKEPLFAIKKGTADAENIGIDISKLTTENYFARKISDMGNIEVEFTADDKNNYYFNHDLKEATYPDGEKGKFNETQGYIGSAIIDLSSKSTNITYTLVEENETASETEIKIANLSGWLPTFNGVVPKYKNSSLVSYYKVIENNKPSSIVYLEKDNLGKDICDGNINIKLIKTDSINNKRNIQIIKKSDNKIDNYSVKIEYYHSTGIKLGEFTLVIKNDRVVKDLGTSTVKIDARLAQLDDAYSLIGLKSGEVYKVTGGTLEKLGEYSDFIGTPTEFSGINSNLSYTDFLVDKVVEINDSVNNILEKIYTIDGVKYSSQRGSKESIFPVDITLGGFFKVNTESKLFVSKYNLKNSDYKKNNKFLISGKNGNEVMFFSGDIQEEYYNLNGEVISNIADKNQNIFLGKGNLNLIKATLGMTYYFAKGESGDLKGNDNVSDVILEVSDSKSLNASGIVPNTISMNKRIANKLYIDVGNGDRTMINLVGDKLESDDIEIGDGKIKIGIDSSGRLIVTKTKEGNIPSTNIKIDYSYTPNSLIKNGEILLGTFNLTVENPIIESKNEVTVKIDKRFFQYQDKYNWLFRDGNATSDITKANLPKTKSFSDFFIFSGMLDNFEEGEIKKGIEVAERKFNFIGFGNSNYKAFHIDNRTWRDQAAVPNRGNLEDINNLIVISKGNKVLNPNLNNKFSILYMDNSKKYKIYKGNLKEEVVGAGVTNGSGKIDINEMLDDTLYEFKKEAFDSKNQMAKGIDNTTSSKILSMNEVKNLKDSINPLPNGSGEEGISANVIANKIIVGKSSSLNDKKTVNVDGIEFGIGENGGLTIKKSKGVSLLEDKVYEIKFIYITGLNDLKEIPLSNFTLTVTKSKTFEIEGGDTLDFGNMLYDPRNGEETYETRVKTFKVKNPDSKIITFKVNKETAEMVHNNKSDKLNLKDIVVTKKDDTSFNLKATAVIKKETVPGSYNGEIEVVVTIDDSQS